MKIHNQLKRTLLIVPLILLTSCLMTSCSGESEKTIEMYVEPENQQENLEQRLNMKCQLVFRSFTRDPISRCENSEVICYLLSDGVSCKFKENK